MNRNETQSIAHNNRKVKQSKHTFKRNTDIAVIGMACRFPGAENYKEFWKNLREGLSSIQEIPLERWDWKTYWGDPQTEINKSNSKWGGFVKNVDAFDPGFFGLSVREAESMDPQQRIMLELSWACFEDAGICPSHLSGEKVGVYIGVFNFDYKELQEKQFGIIDTYHSLGTASAVIPNRISHFFHLKGPSLAIDTACSSSHHAIHSAIQSLHTGECSMALAGGISLLLTPTRHISFSKTGMLSPSGSCKAFDENADGYVRSEGAGLILLKPLENALDDGDSIYGILKGSAVNHNGKTHTLTYPDPKAQAEVIIDAYKRAGITPASISYIEAHGTGTPKGDPLEFQGLLSAFQFFTPPDGQKHRKEYCGLGSVKANIGHLESAAGIAGVIKVLLSMKYKQLPGLQNYKQLNHRISVQDTPFYIVNQLQEWKPIKGENNQVLPRRAGISSFGFGGTNAHVLLEEAPAVSRSINKERPFQLICLSAKTEAALKQREQELVFWLEKEGRQHDVADISATLLLCRDHFGIRAAYVVKDVQELQRKITEVLEKGQAEGYVMVPSEKIEKQVQSRFIVVGQTILNELHQGKKINKQEYSKKLMTLAELYVNGCNLNWKAIYGDVKPLRISLPTYPFAKERYWIPKFNLEELGERRLKSGERRQKSEVGIQVIHPLLHQNTSNLSEQRFSSTFTGEEFFLSDHVLMCRRVLPGVAYLEMARAAVAQATTSKESQNRILLKNVIWARPVAVGDQPVQLHIGLFPEDSGEIAYEIYGESEEAGAEPVVYSQGSAVLCSVTDTPSLSLPVLQAQCGKNVLTPSQCYEAFRTIGIEYGPGHQGIEKVYVGDGQILAKLSLPPSVFDTKNQFVLHPSMMDSALQASLLMCFGGFNLALPFALQELEIFSNCTVGMWAFIRSSEGSKAGDKLQKLDIDLCDEQGNVCARMKGFSSRVVLEGELSLVGCSAIPETLLLEPTWKEQTIAREATTPGYTWHVVILCELKEVSFEEINAWISGVCFLTMHSEQRSIEQRFQEYATRAFEEIQGILNNKPKGKVLVQVVVSNQNEKHLFTGLSGLLKTAQLENPSLIGQLIEVDPGEASPGIIDKLKENSRSPIDSHVRYRDNKRYVSGWSEIEVSQEAISVPWKDNGVYLITGGAGGLGLIFANEISQKAKNTTLILTGRSSLKEDKLSRLKELEALGSRIVYKQVDVTRKEAVADLIQSIQEDFGNLSGIIHAAGVIQDNFIIKKSKKELLDVLAPKVGGLVNLDEATKDLSLDFFIFFSSIAGSFGNIGQSDYSTANAFMDAYADYRNNLAASNQRKGQTLSINWPLWKEGGMGGDEATEKILMQNTGMIAMQTQTGIRALYQGLISGKARVMVMEGRLTQIKQRLLSVTTPKTDPITITKEQMGFAEGENFKDRTLSYVKQIISNTLKVNREKIDINTSLDRYGLDSIMVLDINNQLRQHFSDLSQTLFFEYSTINELADYFTISHKEALVKLFEVETLSNQSEKRQKDGPEKQRTHQFLSKSNRTAYLSKQRDTIQSEFDSSLSSSQISQIKSAGNITEMLFNQIEKKNLFIDDIIRLFHVNVYNNGHVIQSSNDISEPVLIHEKELKNNPEIAKLIASIDSKSLPIGYERLLYQYFFISSNKNKYLRIIIDRSNKLIIPYFNTDKSVYQELRHYCQKTQQQLLLVDKYYNWIDSDQTKLIPLGVWQDIDINQFALSGNRMRKLRYLVDKFNKAGDVKTEEYHSPQNLLLQEMKDLMFRWSESKKNIIHHSFVSMKDLLQNTLPSGYRAFLTYYNKKLCSIIVIEKSEEGAYLMDQEFYDPKAAPLGHMEYSIVEIIKQLKKEHAEVFSLGLTWYPFIFEDHPKKDIEGWKWLTEQNEKQTLLSRIFRQGETNYQFKKKFGVIGEPVFAYLPHEAPFSVLLSYWPVFFQNSLTYDQLVDHINAIPLSNSHAENKVEDGSKIYNNLTKIDERRELLTKTSKLEALDYCSSPLDLITDSWFMVRSDAVKNRIAYLKTKPHRETTEVLHTLFPFKHIILTTRGRTAEQLFYQAFPKIQKKILITIPWTSTLMNQLNNGFNVVELPDPSVQLTQSDHLFKGEMDLDALKEKLNNEGDDVALVGLEVLSNASGGHPVRLSHIRRLKSILQQNQIPLVLDASRIVRNALLLQQYEDGCSQNTIWDIVKQILLQADHVVTSLTKDFAVPVGGLIATNDDQLAQTIIQSRNGNAISPEVQSMIIQALSEPETIGGLITTQMAFTKRVHDLLTQYGVPILRPAYGHAVAIDISNMSDGDTNIQKKENFLKRMFIETGIRASIHQVGKQKNTMLDQCIRLAFPLGLTKEDESCIYTALQDFFKNKFFVNDKVCGGAEQYV